MKEVIEKIKADYQGTVRFNPKDDGTLIGLPYPFTVPNVRHKFQELYYWDTYFASIGLIELGDIEMAKNNADNMLYLVEKLGFIPNGSRTFFLTRSQPPFLSQLVRDIYEKTADKDWLDGAYGTIKKEYEFWQTKRIFENGLNGYTGYDTNLDITGDVQYFVDRIYHEPLGEKSLHPEFGPVSEMSEDKKNHYYCAALSFYESGWDYSSRFLDEGHKYCAVDLNSLLYGIEKNMEFFAGELDNNEARLWAIRAEERKEKMEFLWCDEAGLYLDRKCDGTFSPYKSLASVYPLYVGLISDERAKKAAEFIKSIELPYGFPCGEDKLLWHLQWDFPKVWAPLQIMLYKGLKRYGYDALAKTVAEKWIKLVDKNFNETGELWEKYDGATGGKPSSACAMTGWSAGAYIYFSNELSK